MTAPRFELCRVQVEADEAPGIFTVLAVPARKGMTRRRFLGTCVTASAIVLINRSALAMLSGAQGTLAVERAATFALPKVLTMAGIFSSGAVVGSVEKGYHLRIFSDLSFPDEAFVLGPEALEEFVSQDDPDKPFVIGGDEPDRKLNDETNRVPHQFFVYRRKHFPHFDRTVEITSRMLRKLRNSEGRAVVFDRVEISIHRKALREYLIGLPLDVVAAFLPGIPLADLARRARELPSALSVELMEIRFPRLNPGDAPRRVVHNVDISSAIRSPSSVVVLEGFADEDPDPMRRMLLKSGTTSVGGLAAGQFVEGHYETLRLVSHSGEMKGCTVRYTYMADDTVVAPDQDNPVREQWQLLDSLPFITHYRTWQSAKSELFRHTPQNRYLDFDAPEVGTDVSKKLDAKYAHLFRRLQQVFVRMHLARLRGTPFLEAASAQTLTTLRYEPHLFFELWCMDPNIARIMGHLYPDVPGQQNRREPEIGVEYDYMVTTAWQEQSAQRVCYITQKVSAATTPPLLKPSALAGKQLEGFSSETGKLLHRVGIEWLMPPAESALYGFFEPPLFDVRRADSAGALLMLTHYVDANPPGIPLGQRIFDVPAQTPISPPTTAQQRALLPSQARLALEFLDALHSRDSRIALTAAHLAAYIEMQQTPFARFFKLPDPKPRFQDWVEVPGLSPKTYRYGVRAIDLFGRVSPWSDAVSVSVANVTATPEAVALTAAIEDDGSLRADGVTPAGLLRVSWRFGAHQGMSGAPVDHFNVCWAMYDRSGPSPEIIVRTVYHDVLGREPTATELAAKSASVAAHQLTPRQLAVSLAATATSYKLGNPRRYFLWNPLKTNIAYRPPVPFKVVSDVALDAPGTWMLAGSMTSARVTPSANALRVERELFGASSRVIFIETDQSWWGHAPVVMAMPSYVSSNVVDMVELRTMRGGAAGTIYPVVSFEPGEVLRIGIVVPAPDGTDPGAAFIAASPGQTFHLRFTSLRSGLRWTQTVLPAHVLRLDDDAEATEDGETEPEDPLIDREVVRLRLAQPLSVEITGRESWLTDHAVVKLTHAASTWRAELRDFAAITVSVDALHFGSVLAGAVPSGHSSTLAVEVRNAGSAALAFAGASVSGAGFVLTGVPAVGDVPPNSSISLMCTFAPATVAPAVGTLTLSLGTEQLTLPLLGTGVATVFEEGPHPLEPTARTYLAEVALAQIVHEGPPAFSDPNPVPVLNAALIAALESSGALVTFEIEPVPVRRIVIDRSATDGTSETAQIMTSKGGEVAFLTVDERLVVCEALSRPAPVGNSGEGSRLSFLLRQAPRLPVRAEGPDQTHQCTFHHIYREDIPLGLIAGLPSPSPKMRLAVAVSTHKVPAGSESVDAESLVSAPERLKLLELPVTSPLITSPGSIAPTWSEPFSTLYASRPKVIDNRTVVQARLPVPPASGAAEMEILRASLDGLRAAIVRRVQEGKSRQPVPAALTNAAWMQAYRGLPAAATAGQLFQMFESLTEENRYRLLATVLVHHWNDPANSLEDAFQLVGRIPAGVANFTDEIGVAIEGSYFYALRTIVLGAKPSPTRLCDFKLVVPDTRPPTTPEYLTVAARTPNVLLRWGAARNEDITEYRVYRSPMQEPVPREADLLLSFTPAQAAAQPDTYLAPIEATRARRRLAVRGGVCKPWLPGPDYVATRGVYRSDLFDRDAVPLISQTATNFFQAGSRHNRASGVIDSLVVSASDGSEPILVAVVFEQRKWTRTASPLIVRGGAVVLPAGGTVLGVYTQTDFNFSANPISAQQISNWLTPSVRTAPHLIADLELADGTEVVVVIRDAAGVEAAIEKLPIQHSRVFVPFGPRLVDVVAVFDWRDFTRSNNLLQGTARYDTATRTLSSLSVADGARIVVDAVISDYDWTEYAEYGSVPAPRIDATHALGGIFEASQLSGAALPVNLLNSSNLMREGLLQDGSLLGFHLPAASSLRLGFVITSASGQSIILRDRARYQIDAGSTPAQTWRYSVVAVRQFVVDSTRSSSLRSGLAQCVV